MASDEFNEMFDGARRPTPVTIHWEEVQSRNHGAVLRPLLVKGLVIPRSTSTRADVPDPLSGFPMAGEVLLHKGHLMALSLGGPDVSENIVPQYAGFQSSGVWRRMERAIELDALKLPANQYLLFHCSVWYYTGRDPRDASERLLKIPKGFIVYTQAVDINEQPLHGSVRKVRFSQEQQQDKTDRRVAVAAEIQYERAKNPADTAMPYADLKMVKGKVKYGSGGEDELYEGAEAAPLFAQFTSPDEMSPLTNELFTQARAFAALPKKKRHTTDSKADEPPFTRVKSLPDSSSTSNSNSSANVDPRLTVSRPPGSPSDMLD